MSKLLSLCIPTNGIDEVFDVLDSIYCQGISEDLYEVVVTDNGADFQFFQKMNEFVSQHSNCIYARTSAVLFANQIECFDRATSPLIKFINHRMVLMPGSLAKFIQFANDNLEEKPVIYYANGSLETNELVELSSFDSFVKTLGYQSSWSGGLCIWKDHYAKTDLSAGVNRLFPHCDILFSQRDSSSYFIDNRRYLDELSSGHSKKGSYDLFEAFAVEYPSIILDLYRDGDISSETLLSVLDANLSFIATLVFKFLVLKEPCSYDLSRFSDTVVVFYSKKRIYERIIGLSFKKVFGFLE